MDGFAPPHTTGPRAAIKSLGVRSDSTPRHALHYCAGECLGVWDGQAEHTGGKMVMLVAAQSSGTWDRGGGTTLGGQAGHRGRVL